MKKFNWRNIWTNLRLILIILGLVTLYSFTLNRNGARKLTKSEVVFEKNTDQFITHEAVNKLLIENKPDANSIRKDKLDLNKLEKTIDANQMIEKSQVFVGINGVLKAVVKQKTPVARVLDESGSFYIDYEGDEMPLSEIHTARVPLVSGDITKINSDKMRDLFRFIHDDDFLKKNIIGVEILPSGSLIMMSRDYNYHIEFGKTINMEKKFSNYKAFFQKAVQDSSITKYKNINLKFTQQVVCTK